MNVIKFLFLTGLVWITLFTGCLEFDSVAGGATDNPSTITTTVTGFVQLPDSTPASGIKVEIFPQAFTPFFESKQAYKANGKSDSAVTDKDGFFKLHVAPNDSFVIVGQTSSLVFRKFIDLPDGKMEAKVSSSSLQPFGSISGQIIHPKAKIFTDWVVLALGSDEWTRPDSNGFFQLNRLPPGKHHLNMIDENHPSIHRVEIPSVQVKPRENTSLDSIVVPSADPDTFYVSPQGHDSANGMESSPWKTLSFALSQVEPMKGHTIKMLPGTFVLTHHHKIPEGIHLKGSGKGKTIIRYQSDDMIFWLHSNPDKATYGQNISSFTIVGNHKANHGIVVTGRHYVKIDSLEIRGFRNGGIDVQARGSFDPSFPPTLRGIGISHCHITECGNSVFLDHGSGAISIRGLIGAEIHDNYINTRDNADSLGGWAIRGNGNGTFQGIRIYNNTMLVPRNPRALQVNNCFEGCEIFGNNSNSGFRLTSGSDKRPENHSYHINIYDNLITGPENTSRVPAFEVRASYLNIHHNITSNTNGLVSTSHTDFTLGLDLHHNIYRGNCDNCDVVDLGGDDFLNIGNINIVNNTFDFFKRALNIRTNHENARIKNIVFQNNLVLRPQREMFVNDPFNVSLNLEIYNNVFHKPDFLLQLVKSNESKHQSGNNLMIEEYLQSGITASGENWTDFYQPRPDADLLIGKGKPHPLINDSEALPDIGALEAE